MVIYLIRNTVTGEGYVGQTTVPLRVRSGAHFRSAREDMPIACAVRRYGHAAFTVEVLEECDSVVDLNRAERCWIERLGTLAPAGYNVNVGIWRHASTAAKISKALTGRKVTWGHKVRAALLNNPQVLNERQLVGLSRGRGVKPTPGTLRKRSINNSHRKVSLADEAAIRAEYRAGGVSQREIGERYGLTQAAVSKIIRRTLPEEGLP